MIPLPHRESSVNRRPTLLAAAALTTVAAISLVACGGGNASKSKDNEKAAGVGGSTEESASPSASAQNSAERPTVALPPDITSTFTPEKAGDAVQTAVLKDNAEMIRALNAAIVAQNPRLPALEYYTEGEGAVEAQRWAQRFHETRDWTITGTVRYFDRRVTVSSQDRASRSYCADESKGFSKVIKTK